MAAPRNQPINPWPIDLTGPAEEQEIREVAIATATEILWALSGRRYGTWEKTARPCAHRPGACACRGARRCAASHELRMPTVVAEIIEIKIDGQVLDPDAYRVDRFRYLVRVDGEPWPTEQNLDLDDDQPGTWSITWLAGREAPDGGLLAGKELASRIVDFIADPDGCTLPWETTVIDRQGVRYEIPSGAEMIAKGSTGIGLVDLWLASVNPHRLTGRARVYSATDRRFRTTGT